jgi:hypothetical protein
MHLKAVEKEPSVYLKDDLDELQNFIQRLTRIIFKQINNELLAKFGHIVGEDEEDSDQVDDADNDGGDGGSFDDGSK